MGALDVVAVPGYKGMWARRVVVEAWIAAGKPKLLWAGRTYEEQKRLYLGWKNKKPGYNAADNPDANTRQPHVRGMALDLAVYDSGTVLRMLKAGFTRPVWVRNGYSQDEPWHFELAAYVGSIKKIPKVTAAVAGGGATTFDPKEDDDMPLSKEDIQKVADAVWGRAVAFGSKKDVLQVLADIPRSVWAYPVNRSSGPVAAIQELADAKSLAIAQKAQIAALADLLAKAATGSGLTAAQIVAAAEEGARNALADLTLKADVA